MSEIIETLKLSLEVRERQAYTLISLSSAGIGFAIYVTIGKGFAWSQLLLGVAVFSWTFCILCGILFTQSVYNIALAMSKFFISNNAGAQDLTDQAKDQLKAFEDEAFQEMFYHRRFFLAAILFFISWHLWEMLKISLCSSA